MMGDGVGRMPGGPMGMGPGMRPPGGGNRPSLRKAVVVFGNRHYRFLWASSLFSFFGMNMHMLARALLAWDLTGSFTAVGAISLSFGAPMLLLSLLGGAVADRVNKRNLSLMTQIGTGLIALSMAVMITTGVMTIEILFVLGLIQGTFFAIGMPARQPLMALVVGPHQILNAMALSNAAMNATRLLGPAVAGVLAGTAGLDVVYYLDASVYVVSVVFLLMVPAVVGAAASSGQRRPNMFREIGHGLRYVWIDPRLRVLMMMGFILSFFGMPYVMLLPGFVQEDLSLGYDVVGILQSVSGVGALAGSLMIAAFTEFPRKPLLQLAAGLFGGAGLVLMALASTAWGYPGAIGAILLLGLGLTAYQTLNQSMLMEASKPEYYGRVNSIMMLTFSSMSVMAMPLGMVADLVGAKMLFIGQGVLIAVSLLLVSMLNPRYIFGRSEPVEAPEAPEAPVPVGAAGGLAAAGRGGIGGGDGGSA
jgi:MFS family permease